MSRVASFCSALIRRPLRAYHLVCARDDAATWKVVIPDGVWACPGCDTVLLQADPPLEHVCTGHTTV
ncbi:hypothetical protein NE235_19780 [Actinoallomurus spadix]|uniref:C2H2-type domain-containing protein n=1 Tax=Actinoallomurus spadix TaxID=79912 RepID=A0ABN0XQP7_9ACTN|nr:hypothetical protein [Actinoallomurus spadix]MCO5988348.1 hypothetical protein [Actinoallomurus spadix]